MQVIDTEPHSACSMVDDPRESDAVEEDDQFACQFCNETFDSQQALEEHGEQEHESGGDEAPKA
jgi:hypothetical protein